MTRRSRAGARRSCVSSEDENAGADDGPDPERHEVDGRKRSLERQPVLRDQHLNIAFLRFRFECRDRLPGPEIG
jgi:hypothetical protein